MSKLLSDIMIWYDISNKIKKVKIINGGELTKTVKIEGLSVSKSVEELINKLGGEIISG